MNSILYSSLYQKRVAAFSQNTTMLFEELNFLLTNRDLYRFQQIFILLEIKKRGNSLYLVFHVCTKFFSFAIRKAENGKCITTKQTYVVVASLVGDGKIIIYYNSIYLIF